MDDYHKSSEHQNTDRNSVSRGCPNEITNTNEEFIGNQTEGGLYLHSDKELVHMLPMPKTVLVDLGAKLINLVGETSGHPTIPTTGMGIAGFFRQICIENHEGTTEQKDLKNFHFGQKRNMFEVGAKEGVVA